jgi:hypothetical protein
MLRGNYKMVMPYLQQAKQAIWEIDQMTRRANPASGMAVAAINLTERSGRPSRASNWPTRRCNGQVLKIIM